MSYPSEVLADTPTLYARLGEASGLTTPFAAADASGNALSGTYKNNGSALVGVTLGVAGNSNDGNTAATFNGTTGYADFGNPVALRITGTLWLEALVTPAAWPANNTNGIIISKGYDGAKEGYRLGFYNDAGVVKILCGSYDGSLNYQASWTVTGWSLGTTKHVSGGYFTTGGANVWYIAIDGTTVATGSSGTGPQPTTANVYVGAEDLNGTPDRFFNGTIDEVAIYTVDPGTGRLAAHVAAMGTGGGVTDSTAPVVASAAVTGTTLTIAYTEAGSAPVLPASGAAGFTLTASGGAVTVATGTIAGTTGTHTLSRPIAYGETVTLAYAPGNVTDSATSPNSLASFSGFAVTVNRVVNVACVGDSLTLGSGVTPWPTQAAAIKGAGYTFTNLGHSSYTVADLAAIYDSEVLPLFDADADDNVLVLWAGTNNYYFGETGAQAAAAVAAYCENAKSDGWRVVVCTTIPRTDVSIDSARLAGNALIVANHATYSDALAEFTTDAAFDSTADCANTTNYKVDGAHLETAGQAIIAGYVTDAIDAALAAPLASGTLTHAYSTPTAIRLTWTAATGGDTPYVYNVHRATSGGFTPGPGNLLAADVTSPYDDATPDPAVVYYYQVVTVDDATAAVPSNEVSAGLPFDGSGGASGGGSGSRARLVNECT
jgi:hypothetical protein